MEQKQKGKSQRKNTIKTYRLGDISVPTWRILIKAQFGSQNIYANHKNGIN